jgi:acetyl esterase
MTIDVALDPRLTDKQAASAMAVMNTTLSAGPPRHTMPIEYARTRPRAAGPVNRSPECDVIDLSLDTNAQQIPARLYTPRNGAEGLTVLYMHGGGWATGDLEINDSVCRTVADAAGAAILSIDYRLAPEHPFPAALEDALAALSWLADGGAESLGAPVTFAVAGLSAGAALAAAVARFSRDGLAPPIEHTLLLCPVTDSDTSRPSYNEFSSGLLLSADDMRWFIEMYLGGRDDLTQHPDAFPNRLTDLSGLAPTTILAAGADPLRDEAVDYAARLASAGVGVSIEVVPGVFHGFMAIPTIAAGQIALRVAASRLTRTVTS